MNLPEATYYPDEKIPYVRVGTDYFKRINKMDRFGLKRQELKSWTKDAIILDCGKDILKKIPKYDDFVICPDNTNHQQAIDNCYNLYKPFTHSPAEGEWKWTKVLLEHIFGDQYKQGMKLMQIYYLYPRHLTPILVLVSKIRQTGKTTFVNWLNIIFGDNVANIAPEDLVNGFNSTYASSNIITIEETLLEKSLTIEKLKSLATAKYVSVNQKFISQYRLPFFGKIILTSNNEEKFMRIDEEEIRFFVRKIKTPKKHNHDIETNLQEEIPAFLYYLTTLPPVDFSTDRTGFRPAELNNEYLQNVKDESKSWLYKTLKMKFEELFNNELSNSDFFYADPISIKERYFNHDTKVDLSFIRHVLKEEMNLQPSEKTEREQVFVNYGDSKVARFYKFNRKEFTDVNGKELKNKEIEKPELPF